jgi:hypothetical protein
MLVIFQAENLDISTESSVLWYPENNGEYAWIDMKIR